MVITVIRTNLHPPVFNDSRYDATIMEYNALTGAGIAAGTTVAQVVATDQDSMSDPAGQIEYGITAGNELGIFEIPNPTVSHYFTLNIALVSYIWGRGEADQMLMNILDHEAHSAMHYSQARGFRGLYFGLDLRT